MYSNYPQVIIGFHGCDQEIADKVINKQSELMKSENSYDWLGHGIYFWENNQKRALDFAREMKDLNRSGKKQIKTPAVIGAIISLGNCLNLLDTYSIDIVKAAYNLYVKTNELVGYPLPQNKSLKTGKDLLLRYLDCAIIESLHALNNDDDIDPFDSVRGVFFEGDDLYPTAGFKEKNHIQICVRNPNCIKGFFHPRDLNKDYPRI